MHFTLKPEGVCCKQIEFNLYPVLKFNKAELEQGEYMITGINFIGGCPGNLSFLAKSFTGYKISYLMKLLKGHKCGKRDTSCMDQFSKCLEEAEKIMNEKEWTVDDCI